MLLTHTRYDGFHKETGNVPVPAGILYVDGWTVHRQVGTG